MATGYEYYYPAYLHSNGYTPNNAGFHGNNNSNGFNTFTGNPDPPNYDNTTISATVALPPAPCVYNSPPGIFDPSGNITAPTHTSLNYWPGLNNEMSDSNLTHNYQHHNSYSEHNSLSSSSPFHMEHTFHPSTSLLSSTSHSSSSSSSSSSSPVPQVTNHHHPSPPHNHPHRPSPPHNHPLQPLSHPIQQYSSPTDPIPNYPTIPQTTNDGATTVRFGSQSPEDENSIGYSRHPSTTDTTYQLDGTNSITSSDCFNTSLVGSILSNTNAILAPTYISGITGYDENHVRNDSENDSGFSNAEFNYYNNHYHNATIDTNTSTTNSFEETTSNPIPDHLPVTNSSHPPTPDSNTSTPILHETPINNPYCMFGTGNDIMTSWQNNSHVTDQTSTVSNPNFIKADNTTYSSLLYTNKRGCNPLKTSRAVRNLKNMSPEHPENDSQDFLHRNQTNSSINEPNTNYVKSLTNTAHSNTDYCYKLTHQSQSSSHKDNSENIDEGQNKEKTGNSERRKNARNAKLSKLSKYYKSLFAEGKGKVDGNDDKHDDKTTDNVRCKTNEPDSNGATGISKRKALSSKTDDNVSRTGIQIGAPILYTESIESGLLSSGKYAKDDLIPGNDPSLISILCCTCHTFNHKNFSSVSSSNATTLAQTASSKDKDFNTHGTVKIVGDENTNVTQKRETENVSSLAKGENRGKKRGKKAQGREAEVGVETKEKGSVSSLYREMGIVMETCEDVIGVSRCVGVGVIKVGSEALDRHLCLGCQKPVCDRYVLHVRDHGYWHADCLKCSNCQDNLSTHQSCYVKNEQVFCRNDYNILFGQACVKCSLQFKKEQDWMRIAGQNRYHIACFLCKICKRQLGNNEKYHLVNGTDIYCTNHYRDMVSGDSSEEGQQPAKKAKRNRTSYTEAQIKFLQERFLHDSNPDGNELEKIANHINLKKRVVQVWFQNNRARLKKTANNTKGGNPDMSGQANSKGRVATPGSLSDSALTMDWDNSLDPAILEDQGYISPSTSTATTPTHHQHHLQHHHQHQQHHNQQQHQQISPSTPHYQDFFGVSSGIDGGGGGGGGNGGSATTSHLHSSLTSGVHHPPDHNTLGPVGGDGVCGASSDQQINPELQEAPFPGSESNSMTLTSCQNNGSGDTNGSNSLCGDPQQQALEDNPLSAAMTATGEDGGLSLDPEKLNTLNSLRNSFGNEKHLEAFRRMVPRERHEQQIRQMMQYHEQQQQQQQQHYHQYHQQNPFTSLYSPNTPGGGGGGFPLTPYYTAYGSPHFYPGSGGNGGIMGNGGCPSPTNLGEAVVSPQNFLHHHHQHSHNQQHHHHLQQTAEKEGQVMALSLQDSYHRQNHNQNFHHQHNHQQGQETSFQLSPRDQKPQINGNNNNNIDNNNDNNSGDNGNNKNNTTNNSAKSHIKHNTDSNSIFDDKLSSSSPPSFYNAATTTNSNNNNSHHHHSSLSKYHQPTSLPSASPSSHFNTSGSRTNSNSHSTNQQNDTFTKREPGSGGGCNGSGGNSISSSGGGGYRSPVSCSGGGSGRNNFNNNNSQHHPHHHPNHHNHQQHQQNPYQFVPISTNGRMSSNGEIHYFGHGRLGELGGQHHAMDNDTAINDES